MNDNDVYVVQCTRDIFEDVRCMIQIFSRVIDIDAAACSIRAGSLDGAMKRRLDEAGAHFWPEGLTALAPVRKRGA